ncbi:11577_t:CDS:10, partial [Ambispora leptoticha]
AVRIQKRWDYNSQALQICLKSVAGDVVYPSDPNYTVLVQGVNTDIKRYPAALLYAANENDIKIAIYCAKILKIQIVARSGGHSFEDYSLGGNDGALVVDLKNFSDLIIDTKTQTAIIGTGNRLGPIYYKLSQLGYIIPAGTCPAVGIGGHSLGGGFGLYSREFGLVTDHILSIQIVSANGTVLTANNVSHPDLFFALRGAGGGNYGIVTRIKFRINPYSGNVTVFTFQWPNTTIAHKFIPAMEKFSAHGTRRITTKTKWAKDTFIFNGIFLGQPWELDKELNEWLSTTPDYQVVKNESQTLFESVYDFSDQMTIQDVINPKLASYSFKAKSFLIDQKGLSDEGIAFMDNFLSNVNKDCNVFSLMDIFGGAVAQVPKNATAFVHRDVSFGIQMLSAWENPDIAKECKDAVNSFSLEFRSRYASPFSYQNYIDIDLPNYLKMEIINNDKSKNKDIFKKLPNEIIQKILGLLNARDIFSISLHVQDDYVWHLMCKNQFSEESINEERERLRRVNSAQTNVGPDASESLSSMDEEDFDENINWQSLYMKLSRPMSFLARDRGVVWLDTADGGTHHWKTLDCDESEYGKVVFLDYVWWFDVWGIISNVRPGIYDVVWRFKVDSNFSLQSLNFVTKVFEVFDEEIRETKTTHLADSSVFEHIANDGGWVEYCLPDQITVPEERVIGSVRIPHSVECKIYNYLGFIKRGLWIDYVWLRIHRENRLEENEVKDIHQVEEDKVKETVL